MNENIAKKVIFGISALIGVIVTAGVYKTALLTVDEPESIGDVEVISDEIIDSRE